MTTQSTGMSLTDRFPHLRHEIHQLADQDPGFRQLFDDYELLTRSIENMDSEANEDREEMISLKINLEVEALEVLSQASTG